MWFACGGPPTAPEPEVVTCADPGARAAAAFDAITLEVGPADEHRFWGAGVVVVDVDADGDLDLFAPGPHDATLFRNDAGAFTADPGALPEADWERAVGAVAGDLDGDGDPDLVVTRWGGEDLLLINVDGSFVAEEAAFSIPSHSQSPTLADVDADGDLDLAIGGHGPVTGGEEIVVDAPADPTRLWLNAGDATFTDGSARLTDAIRDGYTFVVGWTDLDADDHPDWLVANDYPVWEPTFGAVQQADGTFAAAEGRGLEWTVAAMGLGIEDVNGDGADDFLMPIWDDVAAPFSTGGPWVDRADALGLVPPPHDGTWVGWGGAWVDLDLDGALDAAIGFGHLDTVGEVGPRGGLTENELDQGFATYLQRDERFELTDLGLEQLGVWRGFVTADLNRDGWPDLVRRDLAGRVVVDLSRCGEARWLTVAPEPASAAVGAEVTVTWDGGALTRTVRAGMSLASGGPPEVSFGLGTVDEVQRVTVVYPDGETVSVGPTPTRRRIVVRRP